MYKKTWLRLLSGLAIAVTLTACGFAMRGTTPLPFSTMYVGVNDNSAFGIGLIRAIRASSPGTELVKTPKQAEAVYTEISNERRTREVSLNAVGRVEQYELTIIYRFRVTDARGNAILPDTVLSASREVPYDDQFLQSKDDEFEVVFQSIQQGLVARILRRLTAPEVRTSYERLQREGAAENGPDPIAPTASPTTPITPDVWRRDRSSPSMMGR